jgi:hypothetical protein
MAMFNINWMQLFCMGVNLVSDNKRGTQTEGVREQGAEENIWAEEK